VDEATRGIREEASVSPKWLQRSAVAAVWREFKAGRVHWSLVAALGNGGAGGLRGQ
jgi:hypothetical protein